MFCKVENPSDLEIVKNSVSSGSGIKEEKSAHHVDRHEVKAQKTSIARISPSAKLLLKEYRLDSSLLMASGAHGTLLKGDVLDAIKSGKGSSKVPSSKEGKSPSPQTHVNASPTVSPDSRSQLKQSDSFEDLPNTQIRKVGFIRLVVTLNNVLFCRIEWISFFFSFHVVSWIEA